jgi:hypothetical protein
MKRRRGSAARESGELFALLIRQAGFSRSVIGVICITLTTLVTSVATASAQNIIEALFGSLWSSPVSNYAAPNATLPNPEAARSREALPIACACATDVTFQFNAIAEQLRRRPAARFVRRA